LVIVRADAGPFNILLQGVCWVHAERLVHKLIPLRSDLGRRCRDTHASLKTCRKLGMSLM
jgi:hypothetical protein